METSFDYPRLRHCTFVERGDDSPILMIVGQSSFEIGEELGSREKFLEVKRYFDGRHSLRDIARITGVDEVDIREIVDSFSNLGLMRKSLEQESIPVQSFTAQIRDSCVMWGQQIGFHPLYGALEKGTARKEVLVGLLIETYHYVDAAPKHIAVALAHCKDPTLRAILSEYYVDERNHSGLILETLVRMGIPRDWVISGHPIIGTMSLINMLCEIGRQDTLSYLACTSLFEARKERMDEARASMERLATNYGFAVSAVQPVIAHMQGDVDASHTSLLARSLHARTHISAGEAHVAVNHMHDLKHSFDQFHDQVMQYYGDISNYIPRLKVDYFSL